MPGSIQVLPGALVATAGELEHTAGEVQSVRWSFSGARFASGACDARAADAFQRMQVALEQGMGVLEGEVAQLGGQTGAAARAYTETDRCAMPPLGGGGDLP